MKPVKLKLIKIKPTRTKSIIKPIIKPENIINNIPNLRNVRDYHHS